MGSMALMTLGEAEMVTLGVVVVAVVEEEATVDDVEVDEAELLLIACGD